MHREIFQSSPKPDCLRRPEEGANVKIRTSGPGGEDIMTTHAELKDRIADDGVEFIYAMFVEMHGKPCAKLVPVTAINDLLKVGAGFAGFAAGPMSQTPADPDILALPDPASYTVLPSL